MKRFLIFLIMLLAIAPVLDAQVATRLLTNNSGVTIADHSVVVVDTGADSSFETTTTQDANGVIGVVKHGSDVSNGVAGTVMLYGVVDVLTTGSVSRGDFLATSATAGKAESNTTNPQGAFAVALTAGTNATITCMLIGPVPNFDGISATFSSATLPDLGVDPIGKITFGDGDDYYWGYNGTLNFIGLFDGIGDQPYILLNTLDSGNGAPFTFAIGNNWSSWEADNAGLSYPADLNNWHYYSDNNTVAVMEIESRAETVVSIEANSDGAGTAAGYILYQDGQTNYWSAGMKASDSHAYVIGTGANLGTPVLHLNYSSSLATFTGSIDTKDVYNDDATPTLSTYFSASIGGVMVAPNKNVATFTAAGNTSARVQLNDIGGTTNQRIGEIQVDSPSMLFVRRIDAGLSTTMLTLDLNTTNATFGAAVAAKQGGASDTINMGGTVFTSSTATGNVGTGEDDLISATLAAATLATNNGSLRFRAVYKTAANANNKQIKKKFGCTTIYDSGVVAANDQRLELEGDIIRTGAATQIANVRATASGGFSNTVQTSAPTETLSGAITFKSTGEGTDNDDVQQLSLKVWWDPANT